MIWIWAVSSAFAREGNFLPAPDAPWLRVVSFVGLLSFVGIAYVISENRSKIPWKLVAWGLALQIALGLVVLSPTVSNLFYTVVDTGVNRLLSFSEAGATFVFGTTEPHQILVPDQANGGVMAPRLFIGEVSPPVKTFAFWILPTIVFFSALMSVLYHVGVMQVVVKAIAFVMVRTLGTSGAESLSAAGNIFVGQTEAPLLVKPFIAKMTRSELMAVMVGGFATVAGGVMGAYVKFLDGIPNIAGHLVMASLMSAPAALVMAKVMVPETELAATAGNVKVQFEKTASNVMEAAAMGASDGMKLAINVAAMLIAIVALVSMFDWFVSFVPVTFCDGVITGGYQCAPGATAQAFGLPVIMGWAFAPIALLMGVPWSDALVVGRLLGEKVVLTEFIAYINLGALINGETPMMTERSAVISSYALCGFANFASIGIQLGGIGGLAPERMGDLASLGIKAMFGGVLAACMTGAVVGMFL